MLSVFKAGTHLVRQILQDLTGTPFYEHVKDALDGMQKLPSEYFASNCYIGGPHDVRQGFDAGVPNVMWGSDFPHSEGTAPFTVESLRAEFWDLDDADRHTLVSSRAAEVYGFDLDALQTIADEIGPTIDELSRPLGADEWPDYPVDTCCTVFRAAPHAA